ncbi:MULTISPECIES: chorismate-binding protein [Flavobacterium]|uniref:isochorismate synthase n=1 Tax=Flavobacterium keumense TaxID=1306518 RepID=A0ABY8N461_9FLAO|nr:MULTISPECIES: chorismate-binding protein [Flavobacterium]WGK94435.1 chorismate-binding protein [Flavobacterium keumense]
MISLVDKISFHQKQNLPFVVYSKPNSDTVLGLFQQNDMLYEIRDFTEKGFVFASFDGSQHYIIPENESEQWSEDWIANDETISQNDFEAKEDVSAQINFQDLVEKGIQAIQNNAFQKVVLSRRETVSVAHFDLVVTFQKLVQQYRSAFVYCFHHPKIGTWLGASPEQLLKANADSFETMALAGTQKDAGTANVVWQQKEQEEQQFVTDYIVSKLKAVSAKIKVSEAYSVKAGTLWHIKTDISGEFGQELDLKKAIQLLHPTPAVCGVPKAISKAFIIANENYNRSFYTGFLGELNRDFASDLFVNLRCMQIENNKAHLYMGCGITKDSIPEKEWKESVNKSMTMKRIL